ncbi:uncharacterized protein LOC110666283 isoform X2 [Hevea brasiliensis]|uniref:uncharacterized protein LOC110666283 isoform X2 n=1 Tax=Hevea brasiliensis TaxID=3981 RepID=UPI0025E13E05|nr:uncharacterized protein LOC110666283 isoform X2 [Hevea brasiliensis]
MRRLLMENAHLPNHVAVPGREKVSMTFGSGTNKPRLVTSALKQALSISTTVAVEVPASQIPNKAKSSSVRSVGKLNATPLSGNDNSDKVSNTSDVSSAELSSCFAPTGEDVGLNKLQDEGKEGLQLEKKAVSSVTTMKGSGHCDAVNNASCSTSAEPSSHLASEARDISSNKVQDDGKESSQLEQETMSVMRGGEMVQVSYKVYIPKKAPALARR